MLEFSAETSERTLEERFCVGWNSRNARSLLVSSVEKANVSTYQHDAAAQFIPSLRTARRAEDDRKSFSLVLGTQLCTQMLPGRHYRNEPLEDLQHSRQCNLAYIRNRDPEEEEIPGQRHGAGIVQ